MNIKLTCAECNRKFNYSQRILLCTCGGTLDVCHDLESLKKIDLVSQFEMRLGSQLFPHNSGVWRYRELIMPVEEEFVVSRGEGNTNLYSSAKISEYCGIDDLKLKHEGENPTGSFKDRGMTVGTTMAKLLGYTSVACASTGNTSASMASYASVAGMQPVVIIPDGEIAYGKLSQALAYGAKTLQIQGDFDMAMDFVQNACEKFGIYLLNSINPFRIEGQKAIIFEILQQLGWNVPDWIVLPGGNLGNSSAIAKGLMELFELGIITKKPGIAVIQATGANPLYASFKDGFNTFKPMKANTIASAIKIGNPVSFSRCRRGIEWSGGAVEQLSESEIMNAKAVVDSSGIGAEPASCCTVGGIKKLVGAGVISTGDSVVGILTGHLLKDPDATVNYHLGNLELDAHYKNAPVEISTNFGEFKRALGI